MGISAWQPFFFVLVPYKSCSIHLKNVIFVKGAGRGEHRKSLRLLWCVVACFPQQLGKSTTRVGKTSRQASLRGRPSD